MKYKVAYVADTNIGGVPDSVFFFSFYTKSQAETSAQLFVEAAFGSRAYMWDGSTWTQYT
jgi:hypothetical protein